MKDTGGGVHGYLLPGATFKILFSRKQARKIKHNTVSLKEVRNSGDVGKKDCHTCSPKTYAEAVHEIASRGHVTSNYFKKRKV